MRTSTSASGRLAAMTFSVLLAGGFAASCATAAEAPPPLNCASVEAECNGACANLQTDSENCGKCGTLCPSGQACVKGVCGSDCPPGDSVCSIADSGRAGKCVNTKTDNTNCGLCGKVCKQGEICFGGACSGTCGTAQQGQTGCFTDGGSPYCANLKNDNQNCGACGKTCASDLVCVSGVCQGSCTVEQTKCGGDGGPVYCANLKTDNANCGVCGKTCGVLEACQEGGCNSQCSGSQSLCLPDGGTPYCAALLSDTANCGVCGKVCPSGYACSSGQCSLNPSQPSCLAIKQANSNAVNGLYTIDPDGGGPLPAVQVYCDMTAGGHTVYRVAHNWGEWGANMNIVVRDGLTPTTGSINEWDSSCALFGKTKYVGAWKNNGGTYSLAQYTVYADSKDYWDNYLHKVFPTTTYAQVLILQDSVTPGCWAWYAEAGSLQSLGSPVGAG
jgi:hypothetical protein